MPGLKRVLLLMCVLWTGAAAAEPTTRYVPRLELNLPAKADAASIQVLESPTKRNSIILGRLTILGESQTSREELLAAARKRAARLGADFVGIVKSDEGARFRTERPSAGIEQGRRLIAPRATISNAPVLYAVIGVFAKAAIGLVYEDMGPNWGRAIVKAFHPASKAAAAGVQVGDEVVQVDGIPHGDPKRMAQLIEAKPGQVVTLRLKRQETILTVEVTLIPND
jgi:S1-C subfamily serine protease